MKNPIHRRILRVAVGLGAGLRLTLLATPSFAGVVDSPVPAPFTQHVFTVPGVIAGIPSPLHTFFSCTNLDTADVTIGVELFHGVGGGAANDPTASALTLPPGATRTFGTQPALGVSVDSVVAFLDGRGSARILATSKKIACTAFVADQGNIPPMSGWQLTIIAKTKQKAAN